MDNNTLIDKCKELLDLKRKAIQIQSNIDSIKNEIKPVIKELGTIKFDDGRVYYSESKAPESFSRSAVLQYLRDTYSDALADQVDADCTKKGEPHQIVYIQIY